MLYSDARTKIRTGDIFSCSGTAIYSKGIRAWTGDEITHTGIAIWATFPEQELPDRLCILEAHAFKGVQLHLLSRVLTQEYWRNNGKVYWQPLVGLSGNKVASFALNNWSKSYASFHQLLIASSRLSQMLRRWFNCHITIDDDRFHCSELATRALMDAGYKHDKDASITTPGDVSRFRCLLDKVLLEPSSTYVHMPHSESQQ